MRRRIVNLGKVAVVGAGVTYAVDQQLENISLSNGNHLLLKEYKNYHNHNENANVKSKIRFQRKTISLYIVKTIASYLYLIANYLSIECTENYLFTNQKQSQSQLNLRSKSKEDQPDVYAKAFAEVNERTAKRLLWCCGANGGLYTKLAQQIASLNHALPPIYCSTLSFLQDQSIFPPLTEKQLHRIIQKELQLQSIDQVFHSIDVEPIASASLAQVHAARLQNNTKVAVKIQYPSLIRQVPSDFKVLANCFDAIQYFFPEFEFQWILPLFQQAVSQELDFRIEKENAKRIACHFKGNSRIYVPKVFDEHSTKHVLVMEFIENGVKINDIPKIKSELGLQPKRVASLLCQALSEMIFFHGFVHCDPHPGNIFVRRRPDCLDSTEAEQLVLLDHGLYRELNDEFRLNFCQLWKALLCRDTALLNQSTQTLFPLANLNSQSSLKYSELLPFIFTYRSWDSKSKLAGQMSVEEKEKLKSDLRQLTLPQVNSFLQQMHPDMLFLFRIINLNRSLNKDLGGTSRDRFHIMGKYAILGYLNNENSTVSTDEIRRQPIAGTGLSFFRIWRTDSGSIDLLKSLRYSYGYINLITRLHVIDSIIGFNSWYSKKEVLPDKHIG